MSVSNNLLQGSHCNNCFLPFASFNACNKPVQCLKEQSVVVFKTINENLESKAYMGTWKWQNNPYYFYTLTFAPPGLVSEFQKKGEAQQLTGLKTYCTYQGHL